jgi:hypothetical protein
VASSHSCFVPFFGLQHELKVRLYMAIDEVGIVLFVAIVVVCNSMRECYSLIDMKMAIF